MKCWLADPFPIQWQALNREEKKQVIKRMNDDDVEFLTYMRKTFDAVVLELDIDCEEIL